MESFLKKSKGSEYSYIERTDSFQQFFKNNKERKSSLCVDNFDIVEDLALIGDWFQMKQETSWENLFLYVTINDQMYEVDKQNYYQTVHFCEGKRARTEYIDFSSLNGEYCPVRVIAWRFAFEAITADDKLCSRIVDYYTGENLTEMVHININGYGNYFKKQSKTIFAARKMFYKNNWTHEEKMKFYDIPYETECDIEAQKWILIMKKIMKDRQTAAFVAAHDRISDNLDAAQKDAEWHSEYQRCCVKTYQKDFDRICLSIQNGSQCPDQIKDFLSRPMP